MSLMPKHLHCRLDALVSTCVSRLRQQAGLASMRAAMGSPEHTRLLEGLRPATLVQVVHAIAGFHADPMVSLKTRVAMPAQFVAHCIFLMVCRVDVQCGPTINFHSPSYTTSKVSATAALLTGILISGRPHCNARVV